MEMHVIVNREIYLSYKKDVYHLSPRLFCEEYFYQFPTYEVPVELTGMKPFLPFVQQVVVYATASFTDFINLLLLLDFLWTNQYVGSIQIHYVFKQNRPLIASYYASVTLERFDYMNVSSVLQSIMQKKEVCHRIKKIPGFDSYIQFYNLCLNQSLFREVHESIFEMDDKEEQLAALSEKYSHFHFKMEYLKELLKNMDEG